MAFSNSLKNRLLIAMPGMNNPIFYHAVIYICEQQIEGTVGLIINKPLQIPINLIFDQLNITPSYPISDIHLLYGGPVQPERGFVMHRPIGQWDSSLNLGSDLTITTSNDIIKAIAQGHGPKDVLIALGYVSWDNEQLNQELLNNYWLDCPYEPSIIYQVPLIERWKHAAYTLGIDITKMSNQAGHG